MPVRLGSSFSPAPSGSFSLLVPTERCESEGPESIPEQVPLRTYLSDVQLPVFKMPNKPLLTSLIHDKNRAAPWPEYKELKRPVGTRPLREVQRIPLADFVRATRQYLEVALRDVYIRNENMVEEEISTGLHLPTRDGFLDYGEEDMTFLANIKNEDDLLNIMKHYVLDTVSECLRLVQGVHPEAPITQTLKFNLSNHLCPTHHARWDIFTLPPDTFNPLPVVVIFIPPWDFTKTDFQDFLAQRTYNSQFQEGQLDALGDEYNRKAHTLWALLQDICIGKGERFVVTNYLRWSYGLFVDGYKTANVTESFGGVLRDFDWKVSKSVPIGCNPIEFLIYWIQRARGMAHCGNN